MYAKTSVANLLLSYLKVSGKPKYLVINYTILWPSFVCFFNLQSKLIFHEDASRKAKTTKAIK